MQTAAVSMALRSAIADVQAAVERVEDKVSDIQRRLGARQLGDVVGSYRRLSRVVEATSARGELLDADWDSVAGAGLDLERDLETMRAYVTTTVDGIDVHARLPKRESAVKRLSDPNGVTGTLRLILVAEQALHLWEYLRIERIRQTQPEHLESALDEARTSLASQRERDEELVRTRRSASSVHGRSIPSRSTTSSPSRTWRRRRTGPSTSSETSPGLPAPPCRWPAGGSGGQSCRDRRRAQASGCRRQGRRGRGDAERQQSDGAWCEERDSSSRPFAAPLRATWPPVSGSAPARTTSNLGGDRSYSA